MMNTPVEYKLHIAAPKFIAEKALDTDMPPGHRFNLYAPMWVEKSFPNSKEYIWGIGEDITEKKDRKDKFLGKIIEEGHEKRDGGKAETLKRASEKYADEIKNLLENIYNRQSFLAQKLDALVIPIKLTSPFAVGLGNDHPVENGFSFLSPYGLPYISGSGIKGVLRSAAQESGVPLEEIEILFGEDQNDATRGALIFWDGFPQCDRMTVEVMTPHQSDYYQGKSSPHDQGTPTPIQFLAVPANTNMNLIIQCDTTKLKQQDYDWQAKVIEIVNYASKWLGFGAKTFVGYGSFKINNDSLKKQKEIQNKKDEEKKLASLSPEEREKQNANIELKKLIAEFENIKATEKKYIANNSKLNPKLKNIYEICGKLKNNEAKTFLDNVYSFVKENKTKRNEVKQITIKIFG